MSGTTFPVDELARLYRARKGVVDYVEVPECGFAMIDGCGAPDGTAFANAIKALYATSYTAHFALKKAGLEAPKVHPLEALWWLDDTSGDDIVRRVMLGTATMDEADRSLWRWRALIAQPAPLDETVVLDAVSRVAHEHPELPPVRFEPWAEGLCAQVLHLGPYDAEAPTIALLHETVAADGYRLRGLHHEIYLGDPRRSAPERLRTIIRHPVERIDS